MTSLAATALARRVGRHRVGVWSAAAIVAIVAVSAGLIGTYRYLDGYWLYRGYPPPRDPAFVTARGVLQHLEVRSPALGGRLQSVDVYLPPGYAEHPHRRYPVFYLLHGFPGRPAAFFQTVRIGVVEDILLARRRVAPMILVAPFGSTGTFTDKEWANGVRPHEAWETFVARDLVRAVDRRYRTIRAGWARALGGLSEGGYGALDIGLHHPGEFGTLESWSGYELADDIASIFGRKPALLRRNSPLLVLPKVAATLRADRTFVWFYSGRRDQLLGQNERFARALAAAGIRSRFAALRGGHDWSLWRGHAAAALLAASAHLHRATPTHLHGGA
ncbi:MAG TPA: alpha/beta hydrolase-fold protein [Gaiellaceae bacterium]|nr:alpha/beta hydrolase-fold protein [Gaiellaceae bacterium]